MIDKYIIHWICIQDEKLSLAMVGPQNMTVGNTSQPSRMVLGQHRSEAILQGNWHPDPPTCCHKSSLPVRRSRPEIGQCRGWQGITALPGWYIWGRWPPAWYIWGRWPPAWTLAGKDDLTSFDWTREVWLGKADAGMAVGMLAS